MSKWDKIWNWIHKGQVIRRIIILWALWMSTWITMEVWLWIKEIPFDKLEASTGLVIGALLTPVLGLTGWLLKEYARNPYAENTSKQDSD